MAERATASYPTAAAGDMVTALRTARESRGWSIRQLAKEIGASPSCVMYWERGEKRPSLVHFIGWAEVLGYDVRLQRPAGQPEVAR